MFRSKIVFAIFKRNLASYFSGVLGYLFIVVFVVVAAWRAFTPEFFANNVANLDQLSEFFPLLLLFIIPAITMTAWSEERKLGTEELLFTLPATDFEIVIAKYLAVLAVYTIALLFSVFQLSVLIQYAEPDVGLLITTYFGYWLSGAALLSAGMVASALTSSSTVAFVLGAVLCAIPVFIGDIANVQFVREYVPVLRELSLSTQLQEFALGMIPLNGVVFFVSLTAFMLYLNLMLISRRHWSGDQRANMGLQYGLRIASLVVVLISLNMVTRVLAGQNGWWIDATADNSFTLSDSTKDLLKSIDKERPVTIQAFVSEDVPGEYAPLKKRLLGLLSQYDKLGGSRITVRIVNVKPHNKSATEARSAGVARRRIQTERQARQSLYEVFLGAKVTSPTDEVIIPAFEVDTPIEYELTRSIRTVSQKSRRLLGVLDTDAAVDGGFDRSTFQQRPVWGIMQELRKQYEVVKLSPDIDFDEQHELFTVNGAFAKQLDGGKLPGEIRKEFKKNDIELGKKAKVELVIQGNKWRLTDGPDKSFKLIQGDDKVTVHGGVDVLLAVLPSSLTQRQMQKFVDAIEAGMPTLIFDDPMPVTIGLQNAPSIPKRPSGGGMFGQQGQPPPEPRADGGKATTLMNALDIRWDSDDRDQLVTVWDNFEPHPKISQLVPPDFVFISPQNGVPNAIHLESKITKGMQQLFALFPGRIKQVAGSKLNFDALLRTGKDSGEIKFSDRVESANPFSGPRINPNPRRVADKWAHTLGAHIYADDDDDGLNVVYVADVDLISDYALTGLTDVLRQGFDYELKLDNLNFVLNSIDLLAGDEANVDLRNRRSHPRPLAKIQEEINKFREERQEEEEKAEKKAKKEIDKAQKRLTEAAEKITEDSDASVSSQVQDLFTAQQAETTRLARLTKKIEEEKEARIDELKAEERDKIEALESRIRWGAVLLPPVPPILLMILVLGIRFARERREIDPARLAS